MGRKSRKGQNKKSTKPKLASFLPKPVEIDPLELPAAPGGQPAAALPAPPEAAPVEIPPVVAEARSGPVGVTRAVAAAALGVPASRISQWVADGCPVMQRSGQRGEHSLYDVDAIREWRDARGESLEIRLSLEEERAKLAQAQRIKHEFENRVRQGELLERAEVVAEARALLLALRTRLLQIPRQLGQADLIARESEHKVTKLVNEALAELADWRWSREVAAADKANAEPAAEN